jgi:DNA-binding transcriptional MocR family regulator
MKLYEQLASQVGALIRGGTLKPGERIPSVRETCRERRVSPATALRAYELLESHGLIETRPRSGYYVRSQSRAAPSPKPARAAARTGRVDVSDLVFEILEAARDRDVVPLGSAFPGPMLFPWGKLARHLGSSARQMDPWGAVESVSAGSLELRRQIARRYLRFGIDVQADEIVITSGALEALNLSLQVLARPGDAVAIESPAFYGCLQAIEAAGLRAVEIPTDPRDGVDVGALARAIDTQAIRACWLMPNLQNPLGATMPDPAKRALAALLKKHDIPLIEDDVYSELHFDADRPRPVKAYGGERVLHCGSFSKCLAPGYRLGWVAAGRHAREVERRKIMSTLATSLPVQEGIAQFMRQGGYEAHLTQLRRSLAAQQRAALRALSKHFPAGYRVTQPAGGYFLWIELPRGTDALEVHRRALERGITVAPGPIFSPRRAYRNCLRLNCGHPWSRELDAAIATLGEIVRQACSRSAPPI